MRCAPMERLSRRHMTLCRWLMQSRRPVSQLSFAPSLMRMQVSDGVFTIPTTSKRCVRPYLQGIAQAIDVKTERASLEQELKGIEKQGYKPLRPWQEFEKASLSSEYQSLYWQLCLHAHNNVSALEERHLNKKGDDFEVLFFKEEDPADLVRYFDSVCGLLVDATKTLHSKFGSGLDE